MASAGLTDANGYRLLGPKQDKYIGPSSAAKPMPPDVAIQDGATCLEEDTGRMFRWRDSAWRAIPTDPTTELTSMLLEEVMALRQDFQEFVEMFSTIVS